MQMLHSQHEPSRSAAATLLWDVSAYTQFVSELCTPDFLSALGSRLRSGDKQLAAAPAGMLCNMSGKAAGRRAILAAPQLIVPALVSVLTNAHMGDQLARRRAGDCIVRLLRGEPAATRQALAAVQNCRLSLSSPENYTVQKQCKEILSLM